jgi:hypothetical protein
MAPPPERFHASFEARWGQLLNPHVRALAWLLDAPDLLDAADPHWQGKVASLAPDPSLAAWLQLLERDPAALLAVLDAHPSRRLGLYAEQLMAFYFQSRGTLAAHSLQVRASRNDTVGEFDFLLNTPAGLEHWELATKFYLLDGGQCDDRFDAFVGPNLADSLGAKMRKIFSKQLSLATHPAAQAVLPGPVLKARAFVKGWLFYHAASAAPMAGLGREHCHGFWCTSDQWSAIAGDGPCVVLPRLQWLAPFKGGAASALHNGGQLQQWLRDYFAHASAPVLVASVVPCQAGVVEVARGFVVPDDWPARAAARRLA